MLKPTTGPVRFLLEVERPDEATCIVRLLDPAVENRADALLYEVRVATDWLATSQKRALREMARHLHWFLSPNA
jgi:hypothetical protein